MKRSAKTFTGAILAIGLALSASKPTGANPLGGEVVGGSATVSGQGTANVTVNQATDKAIINWGSFNIAPNEVTRFNQPSAASVALNRVTGDKSPSSIFGTLSANGRVFLINPEGFIFGSGAKINTAAFLATTHDIHNEDFLAGNYTFNIPGNPNASIINQGTITVADTGIAALVAPAVRNDGVITARLGKVALASSNGFSLDLYGDNLINFAMNDEIASQVIDVSTGKPMSSLVENTGNLSVDGGTVAMTAVTARALVDSVINNSGVIEARSVGVQGGRIVLGASMAKTKTATAPKQTVVVSGKLDVSGAKAGESGGRVQITGEEIKLAGVMIDASGHSGGGKVLIGGDVGGGTPNQLISDNAIAALEPTAVPTAASVSVDADTTIDASATNAGNGGKVVVWSDGSTVFHGTILARGGASSGDGGFVETSGHERLAFAGNVDLSAANGSKGTLLLDPLDVTIGSSGSWIVTVAALQAALANGDVIVTTNSAGADAGDLTVAESFSWSNANSLTLSANRDIYILNGVTIANTGAGNLNLRADSEGTGTGHVDFIGTGMVDYSGSTGLVSMFYNPNLGYALEVDFSPYVQTNASVSNQLTGYMLVNTVNDLQNIHQNVTGSYALGRDIDASVTATWNSGAGFLPIGIQDSFYNAALFNGILDGQGHTIDGLTINGSGNYVGLIGRIATAGQVRNLNVTNANIANDGQALIVGATGIIAGENNGTIENVFVDGTLTTETSGYVGGIAGIGPTATGTIIASRSEVTINSTSTLIVGGLVGLSNAAIFDSSANVQINSIGPTISLSGADAVGGLVGVNGGSIERSFATGTVSAGAGDRDVGGLVGRTEASGGVVDSSRGLISQSFATTTVSAGDNADVGGLVGATFASFVNPLFSSDTWGGTIRDSYARGTVTGGANSRIGGLLGYNSLATIERSYATGLLTGGAGSQVGGFVGQNVFLSATRQGHYSDNYWDTTTTGHLSDNAPFGTLGQTTTQLQAAIPLGFSTAVWGSSGSVNGSYPHLLWQTAINPPPASPTILTGNSTTPVTLYFVANPQTIVYGSPLPPLTGTVIGFLPGDTLATATTGTLSFTTTATPSSSVGQYAITGSGLTAIGNYVFAQDPGNATAFDIVPAPLTITANNAIKQVGTTLAFAGTEFSSSGLLFTDSVTSVTLTSAGASAGATVTGGPYSIVPSNATGSGLGNYTIAYVDGALTVTALPPPGPPAGLRPPNDPFGFGQLNLLSQENAQIAFHQFRGFYTAILTDEDIFFEGRRLARRIIERVDNISDVYGYIIQIADLLGGLDSKFHDLENNQSIFLFRGRLITGSDLNYYFQGVAFEALGVSKAALYTAIYGWKQKQYGVSPSDNALWAAGQGYSDGLVSQF